MPVKLKLDYLGMFVSDPRWEHIRRDPKALDLAREILLHLAMHMHPAAPEWGRVTPDGIEQLRREFAGEINLRFPGKFDSDWTDHKPQRGIRFGRSRGTSNFVRRSRRREGG